MLSLLLGSSRFTRIRSKTGVVFEYESCLAGEVAEATQTKDMGNNRARVNRVIVLLGSRWFRQSMVTDLYSFNSDLSHT